MSVTVGADPAGGDAGRVVAVDGGLDERRDPVVDVHTRAGRGEPIPAAAPIATDPANTSALICSPAIAVIVRSPPAPIVEFWT